MSFSEKIIRLQTLYRLQHDLNNQIAGADFAEEKGELSDEEKTVLEQRTAEYQNLDNEATIVREATVLEFPEDYTRYLNELHARLTRIQNHLLAMKGEIEFRHNFNKSLCESLLADLSKLRQNKKTKYTLCWLFDVSASLLEEYPKI